MTCLGVEPANREKPLVDIPGDTCHIFFADRTSSLCMLRESAFDTAFTSGDTTIPQKQERKRAGNPPFSFFTSRLYLYSYGFSF